MPEARGERSEELAPAARAIFLGGIELFLDLICPFSSKMYKTVYDEVRLVHLNPNTTLLYPNPRVRGDPQP